jgi:hypothetical protein
MTKDKTPLEIPKLVSRGIFTATRKEIEEINRQDHLAKIHGLAVYVLKMKTKQQRRSFLEIIERKHGADLCYELKDKILEINNSIQSDQATPRS